MSDTPTAVGVQQGAPEPLVLQITQEAQFAYTAKDVSGGLFTVRHPDNFDLFYQNLIFAFGDARAREIVELHRVQAAAPAPAPVQAPALVAPPVVAPPVGQPLHGAAVMAPVGPQMAPPPPQVPQAPAPQPGQLVYPQGAQLGAPCQTCGVTTYWQPPGRNFKTGEAFDGYWRCPNAKSHPRRS